MKNTPHRITSTLNTTEENISEFEDLAIESIQKETQKETRPLTDKEKEKTKKKKTKTASVSLGTILSNSIYTY